MTTVRSVQRNTVIQKSSEGKLRCIGVCVLGVLSLYYLSGTYGQWSQPGMSTWTKDFQWCSHQCNGHHSDRASGVDRLTLTKRKTYAGALNFNYVILYICGTLCHWFLHSLTEIVHSFKIWSSYITWVITAAHLHLSIINAKDPAPGIPHVCGGLHLYYISSPRARDVEIAPPVTGIKTCLGRERRGGTVLSERSEFPSKIKITQYHGTHNSHIPMRVFQ